MTIRNTSNNTAIGTESHGSAFQFSLVFPTLLLLQLFTFLVSLKRLPFLPFVVSEFVFFKEKRKTMATPEQISEQDLKRRAFLLEAKKKHMMTRQAFTGRVKNYFREGLEKTSKQSAVLQAAPGVKKKR